jgi:HAD superfamily phosphatase (TIGR01668 family)
VLKPNLHVASVTEISVAWLQDHGIGAVLVDADDTLVVRDGAPVSAEVRAWFAALRTGGIAVALLSNGSRARVAALGAELGVRAFALSGKPFGFAFRRGVRALGSDARHTAMVGDQLFTDVLGANCAGLISILVTPLSPGRHAHTRVARRLERWVLTGGGHGRPVDR